MSPCFSWYTVAMFIKNIACLPKNTLRYFYRLWEKWQLRRTVVPIDRSRSRKSGVLFIGYAEGALGLGQAFRANLKAAVAAELEFSIYPLRAGVEKRLLPPFMPEYYDREAVHDINFIEMAADQLPVLRCAINNEILENSYNILRTYWELPSAPEKWRSLLEGINEIWAPNAFIADSFRPIFNGPISIVQPAVDIEERLPRSRSGFGLDESRFYFMFSFDYHSSAYRKNPFGVLEAFRLAFPTGDENVGLVIKSNGKKEMCREFVDVLEEARERDERIVVIDAYLSRAEMLGLIKAADAYVSLHRAEGFGFGMAEALSLERIVIATDYSGNTEFLTAETGFPVPFELRPIAPHEYAHSRGQSWAEPDIRAAAEIMRRVARDPESAFGCARAGARLINERYGFSAVGERMKDRICEILLCIKSGGENPVIDSE